MTRALLIGAILLFACGGASEEENPFVGTWMATAGSEAAIQCDNGENASEDLTGDKIVISVGSASDMVLRDEPEETCLRPMLNLSGGKALAPQGQACKNADGSTISLLSMNLDLSASGVLQVNTLAKVTLTGDSNDPVTCTAEAMATYRRP